MRIVDLRSDTVTQPTEAMRNAMYQAEVGDDVYREDVTITRLEELGAEVLGKEAALFVPSGTMGNQIAVMTHTEKGDEIICEAEAHIFYYEVGGLAQLAGVQARTAQGVQGILTAAQIAALIRPDGDIHQPRTRLICLENTHNRAGGTCYSLTGLREIFSMARARAIAVHTDGARLFNAAVAQNVPAAALAECSDTVNICLSKGLGAPVGSLLVGSRAFIDKARRYRKLLGGGMRQAGILAAAGIVALTDMVERLAVDHAHARQLAEGIAELGFAIDLQTVQTNIVVFDVAKLGKTAACVVAELQQAGVKSNAFGEYKVRFVSHHHVDQSDVEYTIATLRQLSKG